MTTALVTSIAIGIGVDYAIHFLAAYRREHAAAADAGRAMERTLVTAGRGILYNAVVVIAGFMVLMLSEFLPNRAMGYLVALSVLTCFLVTVTTLAALIHRLQPSFVVAGTRDADATIP